jgi:hypothetical protein
MNYVIYAFAALFLVMFAAMMFAFYRERHFGIFIMGVTYGASALVAISIPHWWPLVMGFALAWLLRLMGLEPSVERERAPDAKGGDTKDATDTKGTQSNN